MIMNEIKQEYRYRFLKNENETDYPYHHDQKIDYDIFNYLIGKYEEKGQNFFFRVSQLPFSDMSGQRIGAALKRLSKKNKYIEKWNNGKITVWHTKFNNEINLRQNFIFYKI